MPRRIALSLIAVFLLSPPSPARAQQDTQTVIPVPRPKPTMAEEAGAIRADAIKAYEAGAFEAYVKNLHDLSAYLPNHPDVTFRLAAAQARVGKGEEALATLEAVADMGVTVDFAADKRNEEDFRSIASRPEFAAWQKRNQANSQPRENSKVLHTFADADLFAEDVSYNPRDGSFYVTSILKHKVVRVDKHGKESDFPLEAPENGWNVLGIQVDPRRGVLWVSAQAIRGFPDIKAEDAGKARLSAYGLKSRKRLHTREFTPRKDQQAALGDIALAPNSDLLVADSQQAKIYRISADRKHMDVLERPFIAPQDIAVRPDGKVAFIADYARGIARIDLESGRQTWLTAERGIALSGIDGLYLHRKGLLAVQNGAHPPRIAHFTLDDAEQTIKRCDILERGSDLLGEPTHGVIVGDEFVYIAHSGWGQRDEHGALKDDAKPVAPMLRKLKLPPAR